MKKVNLAVAAVVALAVAGLGAETAQAQAATMTQPFHAGQWGFETYIGDNGGGLLRFFTPRTALVLDATFDHNSMKEDQNVGTYKTRSNLVDLSLGFRHHVPVAAGFSTTFGAALTYGSAVEHQEYSNTPAQNNSYDARYAGAFAELGAQYMPASHLALGLAYRLAGQHTTVKSYKQSGNDFFTTFTPLRVSLYF
jgi:hypothetical protein